MNRNSFQIINIISFIIVLSAFGCDYFEFSPFVTESEKGFSNLTEKNLNRIKEKDDGNSNFNIAVITDIHTYNNELNAVINIINSKENIDFVVVNGDLTTVGLVKEYESVVECLNRLKMPYLVVIGNHDSISNGKDIYKNIFGEYTFELLYKNVYFMFFNNNKLEHSFDKIISEMKSLLLKDVNCDNKLVFTHVPTRMNEVFEENEAKEIQTLFSENDVDFSINGHVHAWEDYRVDSVFYVVEAWAYSKNILYLNFNNGEIRGSNCVAENCEDLIIY